ncbi:MAG: UDP-N-acetylglucosamine pyrophosphorylase, partial [Kiritimatiellaeota bacterium]|nr:UDP-N-acetylglucosamine pyrophosphorylase [Kiritimatiellota bacterium]
MYTQQVHAMLERGVVIHRPEAVEIAPEVRPERLAVGVVLHTGCKLAGAATSIGPDCVLGAEAPMTVVNCQLGRGAALKGGYAEGATFLDGANVGSGAHIRPGTLLEEEAN